MEREARHLLRGIVGSYRQINTRTGGGVGPTRTCQRPSLTNGKNFSRALGRTFHSQNTVHWVSCPVRPKSGACRRFSCQSASLAATMNEGGPEQTPTQLMQGSVARRLRSTNTKACSPDQLSSGMRDRTVSRRTDKAAAVMSTTASSVTDATGTFGKRSVGGGAQTGLVYPLGPTVCNSQNSQWHGTCCAGAPSATFEKEGGPPHLVWAQRDGDGGMCPLAGGAAFSWAAVGRLEVGGTAEVPTGCDAPPHSTAITPCTLRKVVCKNVHRATTGL